MAKPSGGIIEKPHPETEPAFRKNVFTLMAGTSVAQALPIAISPILTRIYTPDDFGIFAVYLALASIIAVIVSGRYELAIMLPHKDDDAFQIMVFAMIITVVMSLSLLLLVIIFNYEFASAIQHPEIAPFLYFLPFSVFISGLSQSLNFWHNRHKRYNNIAINRVAQGSGTASGQLGFASVNQSVGLIAGQIFGQFLGLIYFAKSYGSKDHTKYRVDVLKIRALAIRYRKFPWIDGPTQLINIIANQAPNILLSTLFSASSAGFYYLTQRVLQAPITFISGSVLDVFKQRASEDYKKYGNCRKIFRNTFRTLLLLGAPASLVLFFFIEDLITLVFGETWREAGSYAQIMTPALFLRFMANPLSFMIYISEKQIVNLSGMLSLFVMIFLSLFLSQNALGAVFGISVSYSIVYTYYIIVSARLAKAI